MDLTPIDQLLKLWDERLQQVDENLLALESDATYQLVSAASLGRGVDLQGATRAHVNQALDAMRALFEGRVKLAEVVERAKAERATISRLAFWSTDTKLAEIEEILEAPSIWIDAGAIPLERRRLLGLGDAQKLLTPEQLLAKMSQGFDLARDVLLALGKAWTEFDPVVDWAQRATTAVIDDAQREGVTAIVTGEVTLVNETLQEIQSLVDRDPLSASVDLSQAFVPAIKAAKTRIRALCDERDRARERVKAARDLLDHWVSARPVAARTSTLLPQEFSGIPVCALVPQETVDDLDRWLSKLATKVDEGHWHGAEVGLDRWFDSARPYAASDEGILQTFEALCRRRDELIGRLSARRAQADALGQRGGSPDPSTQAVATRAARLLDERPTRLADATTALDEFERRVTALRRA